MKLGKLLLKWGYLGGRGVMGFLERRQKIGGLDSGIKYQAFSMIQAKVIFALRIPKFQTLF
jgi:hypothetical protein